MQTEKLNTFLELKKISKFVQVYLILSPIYLISSNIVLLTNLGYNYFELYYFSTDLIWIIMPYFIIFFNNHLPEKTMNLYNEKNLIFESEEINELFTKKILKNFSNKWVNIFSIFVGSFWICMFIITYYPPTQLRYSGTWIPLTGVNIILQFINWIQFSCFFFLLGIYIIRGLWKVIITFYSVWLLGSKYYKLKTSYSNLFLGNLNNIGKFIISISISIILLATFQGLIRILNYEHIPLVINYLSISLGFIIALFFIYLIYKITINIHYAILDYKCTFLNNIIYNIEIEFARGVNCDYSIISRLKMLYNDGKKISEWPFNSNSIKKMVLSILTTFIPMILRIIGIDKILQY